MNIRKTLTDCYNLIEPFNDGSGQEEVVINYINDALDNYDFITIKENTCIKDFAIQVVKYLEDHYGEHNYKAFLEVVNDKLK